MKKILFAVVLGLILLAALATVASADNGPHGGFNGSTDACASCHRAHSAVSSDGFLLVAGDVYALCTSCHDGTGAYTNVVDGFFDTSAGDPGKNAFNTSGQGDADTGLFAGGFVNTRMLTDWGNGNNEGSSCPDATGATCGLALASDNTGANKNNSDTPWAKKNAHDTVAAAPVGRATTSHHIVNGGSGTVWGSGNINAGGNLGNNWGAGTLTLECTSCHDPHGNAGRWQGPTNNQAPYPSYRLLRYTPQGSTGFEVAGEAGAGAAFYWNTTQTWSAANGIAAGFNGLNVIPSVAGVMVPDTTVKWYSVNNNYTLDRTLTAYRGRVGSGEIYTANFAGLGDYMGRYYGYKRPSATINGPGGAGTRIACWNGAAMTAVATDCAGGTGGTAFNNQAPHDVLGYWCAQCHDRYLAPGGASRTTDSGDPGYHFRHRSAASGATLAGTGTYTCVDCHNAHGTSATASSTLADAASYATGSILLKADNRAICARCHAGAINYFNITTSPTAPMVLP